jgi:hypothetical protein
MYIDRVLAGARNNKKIVDEISKLLGNSTSGRVQSILTELYNFNIGKPCSLKGDAAFLSPELVAAMEQVMPHKKAERLEIEAIEAEEQAEELEPEEPGDEAEEPEPPLAELKRRVTAAKVGMHQHCEQGLLLGQYVALYGLKMDELWRLAGVNKSSFYKFCGSGKKRSGTRYPFATSSIAAVTTKIVLEQVRMNLEGHLPDEDIDDVLNDVICPIRLPDLVPDKRRGPDLE